MSNKEKTYAERMGVRHVINGDGLDSHLDQINAVVDLMAKAGIPAEVVAVFTDQTRHAMGGKREPGTEAEAKQVKRVIDRWAEVV